MKNHEPVCSYRKKVLGIETRLELWEPRDFLKRIEAADGQPIPPPYGTVYAGIVAPVEAGSDLDTLLEIVAEDAVEGIEAARVLGRAAFGGMAKLFLFAESEANAYMANVFWLMGVPEDTPRECQREVLVYAPTGGVVLVPAGRNSGREMA